MSSWQSVACFQLPPTGDSSERVELLRIIVEDLLRQRGGHVLARSHGRDKVTLLGGILVAVVGSDEEMILAGITRDIGDILVRLANDVNPVVAEHVHIR